MSVKLFRKCAAMGLFFIIMVCLGGAILLPFYDPLWFIFSFIIVCLIPILNKAGDFIFKILDENE